MNIEELKYLFFDLDKTLWNWDETVVGAEDIIESLREADKKIFFHTDNTLLSRKGYAKKLTSMGIPADEEDVITSGYVAAKYLVRNNINEVYALGEQGLIEEIDNQDIKITEKAETVVLGFDRRFSYNKIEKASQILRDGGELIICSTEETFRTMKKVKPHQGSYNCTLERFAEPTLVGKPSEEFRKEFKNYFSYFPGGSLFIGDRFADIETGNNLGMTTAAVMSGEITRENLSKAGKLEKPNFGLSSLSRLNKSID